MGAFPPPSEKDHDLDKRFDRIGLRARQPEPRDRYQTAAGVSSDLSRCFDELQETGSCTSFPLASKDKPLRLSISNKIYGREKEFELIDQIFEKVRGGSAELVLVSGDSGVGKTSVCEEFADNVRNCGGVFVGGKFNQLQGEEPYSAFKEALRGIVKHLLKENEAELRRWRDRLLRSIGTNGQVLLEFLPELELLLGEQPPLPNIQPN